MRRSVGIVGWLRLAIAPSSSGVVDRQREPVEERHVAEELHELRDAFGGEQPSPGGRDVGGLGLEPIERLVVRRRSTSPRTVHAPTRGSGGRGRRGRSPPSVARVELLGRVLADHLQQPVAGDTVALVALHQRLRDQRREQLERLELVGADSRAAIATDGVEVEAADAHRQPVEQRAFVVGEQVVGPVDRGAQGLVPLQAGAADRRSRAGTAGRGAVRISPGVITFVCAAASSIASGIPSRRRHRSWTARALASSSVQLATRLARAGHEQRARLRRQHRHRIGGHRAPRATPTARCAHPARRAPLGSSPGPTPAPRAPSWRSRTTTPRRRDARSCRAPARGPCAPGTAAARPPPARPAAACSPPRPRPRRAGRRGRAPAPARRATPRPHSAATAPSRPGARGVSCPPRRRPRSTPPATTASDPRSIAAPRSRPTKLLSSYGRFERYASSDRNGGNVAGTPGTSTWNRCTSDCRSRSRCSPRSTRRDPLAHLLPDHTGAQDLAAVRNRHHPRRPVHVGPEPVAVALGGLAGVQRPSGPATPAVGPLRRAQRALRGHRRAHTVMRGPERRQCAVTRALHDLPAMTLDRVAHEPVVMRQRGTHRVGMLLPQARRTLQIGEEEGQRLRRHSATPKSRAAGARPCWHTRS